MLKKLSRRAGESCGCEQSFSKEGNIAWSAGVEKTNKKLLDLDDGSFSTSIIFLAILKYMFRILKFYYGIDIAIYAALFQNLLQPRGTRCSDTVII